MKDKFGQVFQIGDRIVYPVRHGSWMNQEVGFVTGFNVVKNRLLLNDERGNKTWIERWDRAVICNPPRAGINLNLTQDEVNVLGAICNNIGGNPSTTRRGLTKSIQCKLHGKVTDYSSTDMSPTAHSIYFVEKG